MFSRRRRPIPAPPPDVEAIVQARIAPLVDEIDKLWHSASHLPLLDERLQEQITALQAHAANATDVHIVALRRLDELERALRFRGNDVMGMTSWVAAQPPRRLRISVLTATRDRADVLPRAVASVRAQTHADWEHVIVDDGSVDATQAYLAELDDPRIVTARTAGIGQAGALNIALEHATGDVIAYLDDDNEMGLEWLAGVSWAFSTFRDLDVVYGARIREPEAFEAHRMPRLEFWPWDRALLERMNIIDQSTIAHRAHLAEARFDATLTHAADWDLALRLTAERDPLGLPIVATRYHASATNRLSSLPEARPIANSVARRALRRRGLRVLAVTGPAVDEAAALLATGHAHVRTRSTPPRHIDPLPVPRPDVVLYDDAAAALRSQHWLERHALPFVLCSDDAGVLAGHWLLLTPCVRDADSILAEVERHRQIGDLDVQAPASSSASTSPSTS